MSAIDRLHNRIDLVNIPFTDRGTRLLIFREEHQLSIRLAERWTKWEREVGHYRQRPPIIDQFTILDEAGVAQAIEVETWPHMLTLKTPLGAFDWVFVDAETLLIRLPAGRCGFQFKTMAEHGQIDRRGGVLRGKRNVAYTTNARIVGNQIAALADDSLHVRFAVVANAGDVLLLNITPRLAFNRSLPDGAQAIARAQAAWDAWFERTPPVAERYRAQYEYAWWVMRVGLLSQRFYFTREACAPSKIHYVGVWHWDQFFHALAYRHIDMALAEDQIRIILDHQREDGMLPDAVHDEGTVTHLTAPVDADVTKPPLAAWTVLKLYRQSQRLDFLQETYGPLKRWHEWWMTQNTNGRGLCEYRHPFSSGLDDSPLWDDGLPVVAPDLNTYLCMQCESLAQIAELIDEVGDAARFRAEADRLAAAMIDQLWDDERGYFVARHAGRPIPVFTPFSLLPLWTGRLPETINKRLIEHLTNPQTFWTAWPLPTVAANDPKFDPKQMWRGPTWVNINYLFVEALQRVGRADLAVQLRQKSLDLVMQHNDIYEYYDPLTAERPPKAAPIFGWTSAVFIDMALQESNG